MKNLKKIMITGFLLAAMGIQFPASATLPAYDLEGQPLPTLAPMLEQVTPSVVNISTAGTVVVQSPLMDDPFFRRFFQIPDNQPRERKRTGLGSGVIIDAGSGYIITNNHVIDKAEEIVVTLQDGRSFDATVIGTDPGADVAVIQIQAQGLTEIKISNSKNLRQGDFVVAIGNPFGLGHTATTGIVSALGRSGLGIESYEDFIQTDASINPGNSGGALVNLHGELVGMNTAILGPNGGNIGIGFAIPANMALDITRQLIEHGEVKRGRLGFTAQDLTPELAEAFNIDEKNGVVVARVEEDSPAEKAGMKAGDVIVAVNGHEVGNSADIRNMIGLIRVGTTIEMDILRNGKKKRIEATIAERPVKVLEGKKLSPRLQGASLSETEVETRSQGPQLVVQVVKLEPGSPAAQAGLRSGDLILSANKQPVATLEDLRQAVKKNSDGLLLNLQRGNRGLFILIR